MRPIFFMIYSLFCTFFFYTYSYAQIETYVSKGEYGISFGAANYRGDLNPYGKIAYLSPSIQAHYQKYFNNYLSIRTSLAYVGLRFSDDDTKNPTYQMRALEFKNDMLEFNVTGTFHFFRYAPGYEGNNFTPYFSLGIGALYTNPYTYLDGKKHYLRPLGTEGQYSSTPHDGKKYSPITAVFPISVGLKKSISDRWALFAEAGYRFTTTDYLDDVSATYAGYEAFSSTNYKGKDAQVAFLLQDRSSNNIGKRGLQRGNSLVNDGFFTFQVGISYNLSTCNCPKVY